MRAPGTRRSLPVAPRVILHCELATSEQALENDLLAAGLDRQLTDLLIGWTLRIPPLRDRSDDFIELLQSLSFQMLGTGIERTSFSAEALQYLEAYSWPGNEEEVRSLLGALAGRSSQEPIQIDELIPLLQRSSTGSPRGNSEKDRIVDALWRQGFNRTRTAAALGMSRKTLYNKIRKFGLAG